MHVHVRDRKRTRKSTGHTIAEFAVAFSVLILLVFFPAISLTGLYSIYFAATTLNKMQTHEAAIYHYERVFDQEGPIIKGLPEFWLSGGLGSYAKPVNQIGTVITYQFGAVNKYGIVERWVEVATTVTLNPFLNASYLPVSIPGLNSPFSVTLRSKKLVEDPTNAPPLAVY